MQQLKESLFLNRRRSETFLETFLKLIDSPKEILKAFKTYVFYEQ